MFVFAIETNGKTVAFTREADRIGLDAVLYGPDLRHGLFYLRDKDGPLWDGTSPFTARVASGVEELGYNITAAEYLDDLQGGSSGDESVLVFHLVNLKDEHVLMIPPSMEGCKVLNSKVLAQPAA